jgi:hypothetical protein
MEKFKDKIFKAFYCAGIVADVQHPIDTALRCLKTSMTFLACTIHVLLIRFFYDLFNLKVHDVYFYGVIVIVAYFFWEKQDSAFREKILLAKSQVEEMGFSNNLIKKIGITTIIYVIFINPAILLFIGVMFLNNYDKW